MQGPVKALNLQDRTTKYSLFSYWVVNLPLIYLLAFHFQLGYDGVLFSLLTAQLLISNSMNYIVFTADWNRAVH